MRRALGNAQRRASRARIRCNLALGGTNHAADLRQRGRRQRFGSDRKACEARIAAEGLRR